MNERHASSASIFDPKSLARQGSRSGKTIRNLGHGRCWIIARVPSRVSPVFRHSEMTRGRNPHDGLGIAAVLGQVRAMFPRLTDGADSVYSIPHG
jgi:hypothetical protein